MVELNYFQSAKKQDSSRQANPMIHKKQESEDRDGIIINLPRIKSRVENKQRGLDLVDYVLREKTLRDVETKISKRGTIASL